MSRCSVLWHVQAQAAALRQVGRGGLNEQAGASNQDTMEEGVSGGQRRGDTTAVSTAEIVRHPSETEQVLRILATQLRSLKHLSPQSGQTPCNTQMHSGEVKVCYHLTKLQRYLILAVSRSSSCYTYCYYSCTVCKSGVIAMGQSKIQPM